MVRTRKRIIIFLLMMTLALSLVAWRTPTDARLSAETAAVTAAEAIREETNVQGGTVETSLFSVELPDGWSYETPMLYESPTFISVFFEYEEEGHALFSLSIHALVDDAELYRGTLRSFGLDLRTIADGTAEQTFDVDGTTFYYLLDESEEFTKYNAPDQIGNTSMIARVESAGVTYQIDSYVYSSLVDGVEPIPALLEGISLTAPDKGLTDPIWPWKGEPLVLAKNSELTFGDLTATATWVPFVESYFKLDIYGLTIAVYQDTLYILDSSQLTAYALQDGKWVPKENFEPILFPYDDYYSGLTLDVNGNLYLSRSFGGGIILSHTGQELATFDLDQDLRMTPSGAFGYSYWYDEDVNKVTNNNFTFTSEPWVVKGMTEDEADFTDVSAIDVTDDVVMIAGFDAETYDVRFAVYTHDGEKLHVFGSDDFGDEMLFLPLRMLALDEGFFCVDGYGDVKLWKKDGEFAGAVSLLDSFKLIYGRNIDGRLDDKGQVWFAAVAMRDDGSGRELLIFKLDGLNEVVETGPATEKTEDPKVG